MIPSEECEVYRKLGHCYHCYLNCIREITIDGEQDNSNIQIKWYTLDVHCVKGKCIDEQLQKDWDFTIRTSSS